MPLNESFLREALGTLDLNNETATIPHLVTILNDFSLYNREQQPLVRIGIGWGDARPPSLARHIMRYAQLHGIDATLEALSDLEQTVEVETQTFAYVRNVTTGRIIQLSDNVFALPETLAPTDEFATAIARIRSPLNLNPGLILEHRATKNPFYTAKKAPSSVLLPLPDNAEVGVTEFDDVLKLLTLCSPCYPTLRAVTSIIPQQLRIFGVNPGVSFHYAQYSTLSSLPPEATSETLELMPNYKQLIASDRRRVDIAIERLGQSIAKHSAGEAIVDQAIALEAILSDKGNKEELMYRLRIRAALFLESELARRQELKKMMSNLYAERSSVVHGDLPKDVDILLRKSGETLVIRLIKKVIEIGYLPDWSIVELTGGTHLHEPAQ